MKVDSHVLKWHRFDSIRSRFEPQDEFELWYWATLSGGTALINAALHLAKVTEENDLFATQIPDVYATNDGPLFSRHVIGLRCDLIHVGLPEIDGALPADIQCAFDAMHVIEQYRDPCVRSDFSVTAQVVSDCERSYLELVNAIADRAGVTDRRATG